MKQLFTCLLVAFVQMINFFANAQWSSIGPSGGWINNLVSVGNTRYVTTGLAIYKTIDGLNYTLVPSNLPTANNRSLTHLAFYDSVMYAFVHNGAGYFRSFDTGKTWQNIKKDVGIPTFCDGLFILNGKLCTSNDNGFYYSSNRGTDWIRTGNKACNWFTVINNKLFGHNYSGPVYFKYSPDMGATWFRCDTGMSTNSAPNFVEFLNNKYYALTRDIYESVDGIHWKKLNKVTKKTKSGGYFFPSKHAVFNNVCIGSNGGNTNNVNEYYIPGDTNYIEINGPTNGKGYTTELFGFSNKLFMNVEDELFYSMDTGKTWTSVPNSGILSKNILTIRKYNNLLYTGGTGYLYVSANDGGNWTKVNMDFAGDILDVYNFRDTLYAAANNSGVFSSFDKGTVWPQKALAATSVSSLTNYKNKYLFLGFHDYLLYRRLGSVWSSFYGNLGTGTTSFIHVAEDKIIAAVHRINTPDNYGVYSSGVDKPVWKKTSTGMPAQFDANCFASIHDTVYAGLNSYGVYVSYDTGNTWSKYNSGIEKRTVNAITLADKDIIIATDSGVFELRKDSLRWKYINGNIPTRTINDIYFSQNKLFVSAAYNSNWSMPYIPSTGPVSGVVQPDFEAVIYPNPVNNSLNIKFPKPLNTATKFELLNSQGLKFSEFFISAGSSEFKMDLSVKSLSPGIYILRSENGNYFYRLLVE